MAIKITRPAKGDNCCHKFQSEAKALVRFNNSAGFLYSKWPVTMLYAKRKLVSTSSVVFWFNMVIFLEYWGGTGQLLVYGYLS